MHVTSTWLQKNVFNALDNNKKRENLSVSDELHPPPPPSPRNWNKIVKSNHILKIYVMRL